MLESLRAKGLKVAALDEEPEIGIIENWYINAFLMITTHSVDRRASLTDIKSYIDMFGIIGTVDEFVKVIKVIEDVVIGHLKKDG